LSGTPLDVLHKRSPTICTAGIQKKRCKTNGTTCHESDFKKRGEKNRDTPVESSKLDTRAGWGSIPEQGETIVDT